MTLLNRWWVGVACIAATALPGAPAAAQTGDGAEPPILYTMDVSAGFDGYVHPDRPVPVVVDLTASELVVGRLDVLSGGSVVSTDVELPAGGVKQYVIEGVAPGDRRRITVRLVRTDDGETLAEQTLPLLVPRGEVLVGVLGIDGIDTVLRSAKSTPRGGEVRPVRLDAAALTDGGGPLAYVIAGPGALSSLTSDQLRGLTRWVDTGGRLVGSPAELETVGEVGNGDPLAGTPATLTRFGRGELTVVPDPATLDADEWTRLLRDVPPLGLVRQFDEFGGDAGLVGAATAGREASVPALPWLLAGIVLFVLLVGPANFLLLRRIRRPELAWLTLPLLSAVFVAAFWIVGRSQLSDFTVSHAGVLVDAGGEVTGRAGLALQTASGGKHDLSLPVGWDARAPSSGASGLQVGELAGSRDGRSQVVFQLEDLGVGVVEGSWSDEDVAIDIAVVFSGGTIDVTVSNNSDWQFSSWGLVVNGVGLGARQPLTPGTSSELTARLTAGSGFYEPVITTALSRSGLAGSDQRDYAVAYTLALATEQLVPTLRDDGSVFFFGVTDGVTPDIEVDGKAGRSEGSILVLKEREFDDSELGQLGRALPALLDVVGASSIEQYYNEVYAYGADEVYLRYVVPAGITGTLRVDPGRTQFNRAEVFSWQDNNFVVVSWGDALDPARFMSPAGEVVVKAVAAGDNFFDDTLRLDRFALQWETS